MAWEVAFQQCLSLCAALVVGREESGQRRLGILREMDQEEEEEENL